MTGNRDSRPRLRLDTRALSIFTLSTVAACCLTLSSASALPDNRAYELVSPAETNAVATGGATPAPDGNTVDYQAEPFGDAATGGQTLYQAKRTATGWQTKAITPKDVVQSEPFAEVGEMFFSPDLRKTVFTSAQPYAAGDQDQGGLDLYERSSDGALSWLSQGPLGGTLPSSATFDGATPDANNIVFDSFDSLLAQATGMEGDVRESTEYLYDRNVSAGETHLVDVNNEGNLLNPYGAILGNGDFLTTGEPPARQFLPSNLYGTTTHAISNDGSKIFFESPATGDAEFRLGSGGQHPVHLYMREDNTRTVALDNPEAAEKGEARYSGASEDGSKVFFISNEGLAGDSFKDMELYMYNTDTEALTAISVGPEGEAPVDGNLYGVTAISNDGSHVYYVARGRLASNQNARGQTAVEGEPNFYVYDTLTGKTTFITQFGMLEVEPEAGRPGILVSYVDTNRPAVPTPDGKVLLFASTIDLTGEDSNGTEELYRYDTSTEALICISCSPGASGSATFGAVGGGSYAPSGQSAPMTTDGEEIFFDSENALVPEDRNSNAPPIVLYFGELKIEVPNDIDVYEWKSGKLYLISAGVAGDASLQGVTPNGSDVLIDTDVNLTNPGSGGYFAVYDARVGGGFPEPTGAMKAPCDSTDSCRGNTEANPVFTPPASAGFQTEFKIPSQDGSTSAPPVKTQKPKITKKKKKKKPAGKHHAKPKGGKKSSAGRRAARKTGLNRRSGK